VILHVAKNKEKADKHDVLFTQLFYTL
jgi:hypothetical protein